MITTNTMYVAAGAAAAAATAAAAAPDAAAETAPGASPSRSVTSKKGELLLRGSALHDVW